MELKVKFILVQILKFMPFFFHSTCFPQTSVELLNFRGSEVKILFKATQLHELIHQWPSSPPAPGRILI